MSRAIEVDVAVVGAGPVGGALACRLASAGVATAVIDRAALPPMEHPDFDGRAYAIAAGSRPLLDAAGLWSRLPFLPCPIEGIRVTDGRLDERPSRLALFFDDRESAAEEPFGWMVEARSLRMALNARLRELASGSGALALFAPANARIERRAGGVEIVLADGTLIQARLVVAADGRRSALAREARTPYTRFAYRQQALVAAIAHARPHRNVALEHFLPAGPFARLPMSATEEAEHVSAIVWTEAPSVARALFGLSERDFTQEIGRRLGGRLGAVRLLGKRFTYPLGAQHAHRYWDRRLVLVGDAAHQIHPIAGQGLNLGFRDAIALARAVERAIHAGLDPGDPRILMRYQRARRPDNLRMLAATDGLDRLFSNDLPLLRLARDLGIAAVDRMPRLKRAFIRLASGVSAPRGAFPWGDKAGEGEERPPLVS